ncbi:hypothetical protein, partial [Microbispora siamensis]|uniref:hypothetical protein n=1 Tax=Microbispora siamensis TaxID=564413 RepID=UPI00195199B4
EAGKLRDEAECQAERVGVWHARPAVAMGRLAIRCQQGAMADAGPLIEAISGIHPTMEHDARVLRLAAQGREGEARELVRAGWPSPPLDWSWLSTTCLQGAAQAAVGDAPACHDTYSALLPYSGRISAISAVMCMGPVDWYLALLASAMGDHLRATRHLSALEQTAERTGLIWWRHRARGGGA